MSNFFIAFVLSVCLGIWLYYKFARRIGSGNPKPAIIGAIASAFFIFIVLIIALNAIIKN